MHCVFSGVVKMMLTAKPFDSAVISRTMKLLERIKVPTYIARKPRSIGDIHHQWKASEFKNFLLFYVPVLRKIIHEDYFVCFALLSTAIKILSGKNISEKRVRKAKEILSNFQRFYEKVFTQNYTQPKSCCTSNLHDLIHLPSQVRNLGGLQNTSAFIFEDFIGALGQWAFGTTNQGEQIVQNYLHAKNSTKNLSGDFAFLERKSGPQNVQILGSNGYLGKPVLKTPEILPESMYVDENSKCRFVNRIFLDKTVYHSMDYSRKQNSCNYFVYIRRRLNRSTEPAFADIMHFILPKNGSQEDKISAEVKLYKESKLPNLFSGIKQKMKLTAGVKELFRNDCVCPYFYGVCESDERIFIDVKDIICLAIKVPIEDSSNCFFASLFNTSFDHS